MGRRHGLARHPRALQVEGLSPVLAAETSNSNFSAKVGGTKPMGV